MILRLTRRTLVATASAALISAITTSVVYAQEASPPPSGSPEVITYLNGLEAAERMAVLEREALREGRVVVYGALGIDRAEVFTKPFQERYPGITVDFVRLREPELVERANLEYNAGRPGADVFISNVPWLELLKDTVAGYVPTTWNDFHDGYVFGSAEDGWTAIAYEALPSTIAWRTDRVSADEAPNSLEEMADPRWQGRAGTTSHIEAMIDALQHAMGEAEANELVDRLAQLQNKLYPSIASLADALSAGEIDVAWNFGAHRPTRLKAQGAPVDFVFQDPLLALGITVSVVEGAPNSYAAALLMEFITQADILQALDKSEGGRIFGSKDGDFTIDIDTLPPVTFFGTIDENRFSELSREAEVKFLRR